jgi:hypothetical protein
MKSRARILFGVFFCSLIANLFAPLFAPLAHASSDSAPSLYTPVPCSDSQERFAQNDSQTFTSTAGAPKPSPAPGAASNTPAPKDNMLIRPKHITPIGCTRPFIYHGEIYSVDSPQAQDAQNLKYFTRDSQKAQDLLTQYQENRYQSRVSAYTGTAGILLAIIALPLGRWISPSNPTTIQSAALLLGTAIAIEGYSYSIMLLRENESLIPRATQEYNHDRPKDPVELQFSTGWSF